MGKKGVKMSMTELGSMFGANPMKGVLASRSEGLEDTRGRFGDRKGGGKGGRDDDRSGDWRGGGGGGDDDRRGGGGGFRASGGRDRDEDRGGGDDDWRGGGNRGGGRDRDGGGRGGGRDGGRDGGRGAPSSDWKDALKRRDAGPSDGERKPLFGQKKTEEAPARQAPPTFPSRTEKKEETEKPKKEETEKQKKQRLKEEERKAELVEEEEPVDLARAEFVEEFATALAAAAKNEAAGAIGKFVPEIGEILTDNETSSPVLARTIAKVMLHACRGRSLDDVVDLVENAEPLFSYLWENDTRKRAKTRFIFECHTAAFDMKFPRLDEATSVLEAFFDSLYMNEIIEEQYFHFWAEDDKDLRDGKIEAMFDVSVWLEWLRAAHIEGEETSDSDSNSDSDSDSDSDEEDIEAPAPKKVLPPRP